MRKIRDVSNSLPFTGGKQRAEKKDSSAAESLQTFEKLSRERLLRLLKALGFEALLAWLFFRSFWAILFLSPLAFVFADRLKTAEEGKRREELRKAYADRLDAFCTALKAGYAPENAIGYAARELSLLYGKDAPIAAEYSRMEQGIHMRQTPEAQFAALAERCGLPEASLFAEVFAVVRKSGGNLVSIVEETGSLLRDHIHTRQEIQTALRAREMEQNMMKAAPLLMLVYLMVFSPGYLDVLYEGLMGRAVMSACLALYLIAWHLADKVLEAERVA